jgi:hypothetical protein
MRFIVVAMSNHTVDDATKAALNCWWSWSNRSKLYSTVGDTMNLHQKQKHPEYVEGCFGCKIGTLELGTGDATRDVSDKKWTSELQAYAEMLEHKVFNQQALARAHVEAAYEASATLGKAYNSDTMPKTKDITKKTTWK